MKYFIFSELLQALSVRRITLTVISYCTTIPSNSVALITYLLTRCSLAWAGWFGLGPFMSCGCSSGTAWFKVTSLPFLDVSHGGPVVLHVAPPGGHSRFSSLWQPRSKTTGPQVSTCILFADILLAQASPTPEGTIPGVEVTVAVKTTTRHMQYTAGALTKAYVSLRVRVQGSFAAHISPSAL